MTGQTSGPRLARLFLRLAVVVIVLAAARPSIDTRPRGGTLALVVDVSGSTAADDIAPTRLHAVKQAVARLLDQVSPDLRVGLIAFSDETRTLTRPTPDHETVLAEVRSLFPNGGTAIGDALQRALDDLRATAPRSSTTSAAPATILLISDGSNSSGRDPLEPARTAAARRIPILAIAVGTPQGVLHPPPSAPNRVGAQPVPPDPAQLAVIAAPTGGRALQAQSAHELQAALDDLLGGANLLGQRHELTLLFAALALLLLAVTTALSRPRRLPHGTTLRRWAPSAGLLLATAATAMLWIQWPPTAPPQASAAASIGPAPPVATVPPPRRPPPPASITIDTGAPPADRRIVEQAIMLLVRHRELAEHRPRELGRLSRLAHLDLTVCEFCKRHSLASPLAFRGETCEVFLHMPFLKQQAGRARLPASELAAVAILYEQEKCLQRSGGSLAPFTAEQRLVRKLHRERLFDLLFVQAVASTSDWRAIQQAAALLRDHHELAPQRHAELRRPRRSHTGPLRVRVCQSCLDGNIGNAIPGEQAGGARECNIRLDMAELRAAASDWNLPLHRVTASVLTHEQEHCIRRPDDREIPSIDAERRLARKLGDARQLQFATRNNDQLDPTGHWTD